MGIFVNRPIAALLYYTIYYHASGVWRGDAAGETTRKPSVYSDKQVDKLYCMPRPETRKNSLARAILYVRS